MSTISNSPSKVQLLDVVSTLKYSPSGRMANVVVVALVPLTALREPTRSLVVEQSGPVLALVLAQRLRHGARKSYGIAVRPLVD
jgi:hypothetical protein